MAGFFHGNAASNSGVRPPSLRKLASAPRKPGGNAVRVVVLERFQHPPIGDTPLRPCLGDLHGHDAPEQPLERRPPVFLLGVQADGRPQEIQRRPAVVVAEADISAAAH